MTYRTMDTDNGFNNGTETSAPVRHLRRRRRAAAMSNFAGGTSLSGFGI